MSYHAQIGSDGEIVLPANIARDIGIKPGDPIAVHRVGLSITLKAADTADVAKERLRASLSGYTVDQFIAERGQDWDS